MDGKLKIVMSMHVDDSLCAGKKENVDKLYADTRKKYKITTLGRIKKHLGVVYDWKIDTRGEPYVLATMEMNARKIIS